MRLIFLAALCSAMGSCAELSAVDQLPDVELPLLDAKVATVQAGDDALVLTVRADGSLYNGTQQTTLAELPRKRNVRIRLRVDRRAPWAHVQWIVAQLLLPPGRFMQIEFAYRSAAGREVLLDSSAGDIGMAWCYLEPPPERLGMLLGIDQSGRVHCGELSADSARDVRVWLRDARARAKRESLVAVASIILPDAHAPWEAVASTYAHLRAEGARRLTLRGHVGAPKSARTLQRLPAVPNSQSALFTGGIQRWNFYDLPYIEFEPIEEKD